MKLYEIPEKPLRIYLESDDNHEIERLILSINSKYANQDEEDTEEVNNLIFYDDSLGKHYIIRGLKDIIISEASSCGISVSCVSLSGDTILGEFPDIPEDLLQGIQLRDYQSDGISACLAYKRGIIQVHTGGGKTEMMIGVTRYLLDNTEGNILVCVPTTNLLYQTQERMIARGIEETSISLLGDGNKIDDTRRIIISTVASAYSRIGVDDGLDLWVDNLICLMMDEAHHSKCRTWSTLIDRLAPEYLLGFSAEPFHRDKDHVIIDLILRGLFGPVIHRVTMDYLVARGYLSKPYVLSIDSGYSGDIYKVMNWQTVNKYGIVANKSRNADIVETSSVLINDGKRPLILVQQIAHGTALAQTISSRGYSVYMMMGGRKISVFSCGTNIDNYIDNENRVLKDFDEGKIDALIGTSTLDEGADIPTLSAVILAGGGKGRLKTIQKVGRTLRSKGGTNTSYIIDFRDRFNVVTQSHFKKRKSLYDEMHMDVYYIRSTTEILDLIQELERIRSIELGL